jgi:hypothetical protein
MNTDPSIRGNPECRFPFFGEYSQPMNLVARRGVSLANLELLRTAILHLPGAGSVLLAKTDGAFSLIGYRHSRGKREKVFVPIDEPWLEDPRLSQELVSAVQRFQAGLNSLD